MRPRRPYETRGPAATGAGRPGPSRPARYLTSGAYVRISRSRSALSLVRRNSSHSACVSSPATGGEYALGADSPHCTQGEAAHPDRQRACRGCEHPLSRRATPERDRPERKRQHAEERGHRHAAMLLPARWSAVRADTILRAAQGRGAIGSAPVSKTGGCRFESCRPCFDSPAWRPSVKVLVVDDQWPMRLLVKVNLESEVVQVLEAENGAEAGELAGVELPVPELPDVILLDVMMPGMDGFEVAETLAAHPSTSHIPIVFLSARADYASQARGLSIGAGDYITKPFNPTNLLATIERLLGDLEAGRLDELRAKKLEKLQTLFKLADLEEPGPSVRRDAPPAPPAA